MKVLLVILIILILLVLLYILALMPRRSEQERCAAFKNLEFAHRGLFSADEGIPENSMAAFKRAVAHGFPIELDVQITKDKQAVIFHDDSLLRMCQVDSLVCEKTYDELSQLSLQETGARIPLFEDVLKMVSGRVPLLIEIKTIGRNTLICVVVNELLRTYKGPFCIESFSPFVLRWFVNHHPDIIRGQLAEHFGPEIPHPRIALFMAERLLFNWYAKPDFVAYQYQQAKKLISLKLLRTLYKTPIFVWTIRSASAYRYCKKHYDAIIFDSFIPDDKES